MNDEIRWLIGIAVGLLLSVAGMIMGAMTRMTTKIEAGDGKLHERINRTREDYVRRDDHDKHLQRLESTVKEIRDEQRQFHQAVLSAIGVKRGGQQ